MAQCLLREPFAKLSPTQLLNHFHNRPSIRFRPVVDTEHLDPSVIDGILDNVFIFNNERHRYPETVDWLANPSIDIEWLIMLHKCYFFVGLGQRYQATADPRYLNKWTDLTQSWINQVEPGFIASDVTGRRIQNWIFAFYYFVHCQSHPCISPDFLRLFLNSLHQQVSYLCNHLTPARNHRTLELYAIFLAAVVFPEFKDARHWLAWSTKALTDNADQDILADGVHCELSTFYHHIVLKNLLAVKQLALDNGVDFPINYDRAIQRALEFALWVHKPDGTIPALSDGDTGSFLELLSHGQRLYGDPRLKYAATFGSSGRPPQERAKKFSCSGYCIVRSPWSSTGDFYQNGHYLIFDCGPLGAGNHGHLDLLNFELAAFGRSLVVDPGRFTYDEAGATNWRVQFRGTAYHNTVQVDGKNQTRYQYSPRHKKFKISGPAPDAKLHHFVSTRHFDFLHGSAHSHEYPAIHERKIFFACQEYWLIVDDLRDAVPHDYVLRFHLGAEARAKLRSWRAEHAHFIDSPNLLVAQIGGEPTEAAIEPGYVSPRYGIKRRAPVLRYQRHGRQTRFVSLLFPYESQPPDIEIQHYQAATVDQPTILDLRIQKQQGVKQDIFMIAHGNGRQRGTLGELDFYGRFGFVRLERDGSPCRAFALAGDRWQLEGAPLISEGASN